MTAAHCCFSRITWNVGHVWVRLCWDELILLFGHNRVIQLRHCSQSGCSLRSCILPHHCYSHPPPWTLLSYGPLNSWSNINIFYFLIPSFTFWVRLRYLCDLLMTHCDQWGRIWGNVKLLEMIFTNVSVHLLYKDIKPFQHNHLTLLRKILIMSSSNDLIELSIKCKMQIRVLWNGICSV